MKDRKKYRILNPTQTPARQALRPVQLHWSNGFISLDFLHFYLL